ncbi:hypothetical protein KR032_002864, partial [Drosophila birchii]
FFLQLIKIGLLLVLWSFFTVVIIVAPISESESSVVTILPKETLFRDLELLTDAIGVTFIGPIAAALQKFPSKEENVPAVGVRVKWLDSVSNETIQRADMWNVYLETKELDRFDEVSKIYSIPKSRRWDTVHGVLSLESKCEYPVALIMEINSNPLFTNFGIAYAGLLILGLYIIIFFELTDPTLAILLMATTGFATLAALGERPALYMISGWVNLRIIIIMLSLMIISGITSESGIFDWLTIQIYRISKGHKWLMVFILAIVTAILSSIIPNVTIVLLMCPIAVLLCEAIPAQTHLVIFVVIVYSNIGGALTLVGEPLNMVIATKTQMEFGSFSLHMLPGVLGGVLIGLPVIYLTMRRTINRLDDNQIMVTAKRAESRPQLLEEVEALEAWLRKSHSIRPRIRPSTNYFSIMAYLKTHYGIRDKILLAKCLIVLLFVQISFGLYLQPLLPGGSLHVMALMGAILLIILTKLDDFDMVLHYLDWSVVLFLGAHFVFIEVVHLLGLVPWLGNQAVKVIASVEASKQTAVAILLIIWMTAFLTALVNNIAVTEMLMVLINDLTLNRDVKVRITPLIWALSYGAAFGANGTLLGAHANLMGMVVARRFGYQITFLQFFRYGFPVMLATLTVASAYLLIVY